MTRSSDRREGPSHLVRGAIAAALAAVLVAAGGSGWGGAGAQDLDLAKVFRCDPAKAAGSPPIDCAAARDLVMQNCTACHTFVPIVKAQKKPDEWAATIGAHRERLPDVEEAQIKQIERYLAAHFNPDLPPPELPPELEALGTNQAN